MYTSRFFSVAAPLLSWCHDGIKKEGELSIFKGVQKNHREVEDSVWRHDEGSSPWHRISIGNEIENENAFPKMPWEIALLVYSMEIHEVLCKMYHHIKQRILNLNKKSTLENCWKWEMKTGGVNSLFYSILSRKTFSYSADTPGTLFYFFEHALTSGFLSLLSNTPCLILLVLSYR